MKTLKEQIHLVATVVGVVMGVILGLVVSKAVEEEKPIEDVLSAVIDEKKT